MSKHPPILLLEQFAESITLPSRPGDKRTFGHLKGAGLACTLATIVRKHSGIVMVLAKDPEEAAKCEKELSFFLDLNLESTSSLPKVSEKLPLLSFPDWETLPYDTFSPHQDIISERLTTLNRLQQLDRGVLIVPVPTLMHRLGPKSFLMQHSLFLQQGEKLDLEAMRKSLVQAGYHHTTQVTAHGEFAIRGSIFDLFPMGSAVPYRVDLFGNEIDSIRTFDSETQRSQEKVDRIHLLPAREFPLDEIAISRFRSRYREEFEGDPRHSTVYQDVSDGHASPGLEYYLPLFFEEMATLFDFLPKNALVVSMGEMETASKLFWEQIVGRFEQYRHDIRRPILKPKDLFQETHELFANIKGFPSCTLLSEESKSSAGAMNLAFEALPDLSLPLQAANAIARGGSLRQFLTDFSGNVLFTAESAGRRAIVAEMLESFGIPVQIAENFNDFGSQAISATEPTPLGVRKIGLTVGMLNEGMIWQSQVLGFHPIAVIPEAALLGKRVLQRRRRKTRVASPDFDFEVQSIAELEIGSPVVHLSYGIGRYLGLVALNLGGQEGEFLALEYAEGDKIYIPVTSLHLVSRYSGVDIEHAPLSRLGSGQWEKVKRKVLEQTRDVAAELLEIYAEREAREGIAFKPPDETYLAFADQFPFEETPDQEKAIDEVIQDLTSSRPMDRVVCGDVGFGKTEVALRATFLAVQNGRQVAILVPTTLLAEQHFQTFRDRFASFPVRVESLSRFKTQKEQIAIIQALSEGKVDIVIGTHKILQEGIRFHELGLLIIDEEHRFGVRQKEAFKKLRAEVNILAMTATPIPRTLNMSMSGMRDLSIIATPPARRLSVKTFVRERNKALIEEAINRELFRGGQVYYLHNDIDTIENLAHELGQWIPTARIAIAHGRMRERELEQVMSDFYHRRYNVLICTTIIETGIDIPTANTIIIERADKFGLAQLHQLRGRVGRSHHQAYAFCLIPPKAVMGSDATKRLEAIESLDELGVGFTLATHDLEIRGAGELLGEEQSGNIQSVGFPLFMELLDHTVKSLKSKQKPGASTDNAVDVNSIESSFKRQLEIDLHLPCIIPEAYIADVHTRLLLYKRIANSKSIDSLNDLRGEMIDRFGVLPTQTQNLFKVTELKLLAAPFGILKIEAGPKGGKIEFDPRPNVDPTKIIALIQQQPKIYQLEGPQKLRVREDLLDPKKRIEAVFHWLEKLRS